MADPARRPLIRPIPVSPPRLNGADADLEETVVYGGSPKPTSQPPDSGIQSRFGGAAGAEMEEEDDFDTLVFDAKREPVQTLEADRLSALLAVYEDRAEQLLSPPDDPLPPVEAGAKRPANAEAVEAGGDWYERLRQARVRERVRWLLDMLAKAAVEVRDVVQAGLSQRDRDPLVWLGLCVLWGAFCSLATALLSGG